MALDLEYLEEAVDWSIASLEAFREGPDIEARRDDADSVAIDVKFIGAEDIDFGQVVHAVAVGPTTHTVSPYTAANFLIFKAYEAATQLNRATTARVVVVAIDDTAWWRFESVIRNGWIDWSSPRFFEADDQWNTFLAKRRKRFPDLPGAVAGRMASINRLWLLRRDFGYEYERILDVQLRGG